MSVDESRAQFEEPHYDPSGGWNDGPKDLHVGALVKQTGHVNFKLTGKYNNSELWKRAGYSRGDFDGIVAGCRPADPNTPEFQQQIRDELATLTTLDQFMASNLKDHWNNKPLDCRVLYWDGEEEIVNLRHLNIVRRSVRLSIERAGCSVSYWGLALALALACAWRPPCWTRLPPSPRARALPSHTHRHTHTHARAPTRPRQWAWRRTLTGKRYQKKLWPQWSTSITSRTEIPARGGHIPGTAARARFASRSN